jgi:hypothetical protein
MNEYDLSKRLEKAQEEIAQLRGAMQDIKDNHTLGGIVATMFCQGCIDDFEIAQEALKETL